MEEILVHGYGRKQTVSIPLLPWLTAPRGRFLSALLVVVSILTVIFFQNTNQERVQNSILRHREIWTSQAVSSYVYRLEAETGDGVYDEIITVENGRTTPITRYLHGGRLSEYDSVEELFDAVTKFASLHNGYFLKVNYNDEYGYPEYVSFGENLMMSRHFFRVTDFGVIDER
ncbi:MAG: hypothetical protein GX631_03380 [Dehalococcoidales bacterium]|nr:hypothetical protein [Dehalococcoidales bacterium]